MIITKLEQRDIPGCREIYNYYVKNTSFSLEETELTADQYEARVAGVTERFPFLVARDDAGNVAGFAYLSDFNPRSGYRHTADLSIYTAPDLRGAGLGAALLAAIEAEGRKMGITNLISIITDENAASCRFHEKNGFGRDTCTILRSSLAGGAGCAITARSWDKTFCPAGRNVIY